MRRAGVINLLCNSHAVPASSRGSGPVGILTYYSKCLYACRNVLVCQPAHKHPHVPSGVVTYYMHGPLCRQNVVDNNLNYMNCLKSPRTKNRPKRPFV